MQLTGLDTHTSMRKRNTNTPGGAVSFDAEDFKYRPDEFLTGGHDDHGQSVRLMFRCPPVLERELEVIRDSRRFPYQTISDIIRHGVIRHAEWLHRMEPDMPRHFLSTLNAINEVCRDAEMMVKVGETFKRLDAIVEGYISTGDNLEAQRLISVCKGQLSKIPDSRWKRDFLERFTRKYARHLPTQSETPWGAGAATRAIEFPSPTTTAATATASDGVEGEDLGLGDDDGGELED